jgi:hypothetical protein
MTWATSSQPDHFQRWTRPLPIPNKTIANRRQYFCQFPTRPLSFPNNIIATYNNTLTNFEQEPCQLPLRLTPTPNKTISKTRPLTTSNKKTIYKLPTRPLPTPNHADETIGNTQEDKQGFCRQGFYLTCPENLSIGIFVT